MGNAGLATPRVRLSSELQLRFKQLRVEVEVANIVSGWFEAGAPLGLTLEMFSNVLSLQDEASSFFETFDTDGNQKVDALEVLAALTILAAGQLDDKLEVIFQMFDFANAGTLNFDEINMLVHSVYRGLRKVCRTQTVGENDIIEVCRRLFDSYNLPYDGKVTKDQIRRWLRNDIEAFSFMDSFLHALALPAIKASLTACEKTQVEIFSGLHGELSATSAQELLQSQDFRNSLGSHSDDACLKLVELIWAAAQKVPAAVHSDPTVVEAFRDVMRGWNVFAAVDVCAEGELDAKETSNLAFLQYGQDLESKDISAILGHLNVNWKNCISRTSWIEAQRTLSSIPAVREAAAQQKTCRP